MVRVYSNTLYNCEKILHNSHILYINLPSLAELFSFIFLDRDELLDISHVVIVFIGVLRFIYWRARKIGELWESAI